MDAPEPVAASLGSAHPERFFYKYKTLFILYL